MSKTFEKDEEELPQKKVKQKQEVGLLKKKIIKIL